VTISTAAWDLPDLLGLSADVGRVEVALSDWAATADAEMRPMIDRQLAGRAKRYRPATVLACHRAVSDEDPSDAVIASAAAVELLHNVSLIVDDILDRSRYRRGVLALHCRYGFLPALMASGYISFGASALVADDAFSVRLVAELMQRLGAAECVQWRLRRKPLGVEDWRAIATEDTGSMFEICARLGTRDNRLKRFGRLLGILYHGCDDVADVRGTVALGGGSERDLLDGILTLPAALAIRDPAAAALFASSGPEDAQRFQARLVDSLDDAERYLDGLAGSAIEEAKLQADRPDRLARLVDYTRELSRS
jgi:geranylgeranyl pyrophosphate synthase